MEPKAETAASESFQQAIVLLKARDPGAAALLPKLERFADYGLGWLALGGALEEMRHRAAAVIAYRRAAEAREGSAELGHRAGQALVRLGEGQAAITAFRRALARDAGFAPAWYSLGLTLQDQYQFAAAAAAFGEARKLRPDFHEAAFNQAIAFQEAGRMEAAFDAFAQAYRLRPASFGRIAQALISAPAGALWLKPSALRAFLEGRAAA